MGDTVFRSQFEKLDLKPSTLLIRTFTRHEFFSARTTLPLLSFHLDLNLTRKNLFQLTSCQTVLESMSAETVGIFFEISLD